MTPLPRWGCPVCGLLLLTLAEAESHELHLLPADHTHVESYVDHPIRSFNLNAASASGTSVPLGWLGTGSNNDSAMRARKSWSLAYGEYQTDTAVIWYAASKADKRE